MLEIVYRDVLPFSGGIESAFDWLLTMVCGLSIHFNSHPGSTLFGLFAEVEWDLISERTKEGLVAARAKGKLLGRPKGSLGKSKLDGREAEISLLLAKEVSKASIAKIFGVSRTALYSFIEFRGLGNTANGALLIP